MKESRLFKIVYCILEKGKITAPELAEKFEVSVRTIYRDIDVISSAGIPIYVTSGRNGGIQILDHYVLEKTFFSDKEKQDILTALQSLSDLDNLYEKGLLTKLSALFDIRSDNWFEVDFSSWENNAKDNTKFDLLKYAVIHNKAVAIFYFNSSGIQSKRKIYPIKLLHKSKEWYLKAYCTEKQDFRVFKLNRIAELELLDENFTPMEYPDTQDIQPKNYKRITIRISKEMAFRVYDEFDVNCIDKQENGDFIVSVEMPEDNWLIGYLLTFGSQAEVIEPARLKEVLYRRAKEICEKNKP